MAVSNKLVVVLVVAMVVLFEGSRALTFCGLSDDGQTFCMPSVTKPNPVDPSPDCCKALSVADLKCLCSYKDSPFLPTLGIEPDLAMKLPAKCGLTPPPNC